MCQTVLGLNLIKQEKSFKTCRVKIRIYCVIKNDLKLMPNIIRYCPKKTCTQIKMKDMSFKDGVSKLLVFIF